ncbi:MAG: PqqD family protein [Blautia sp.]|nr:PqqD family protein [Blautia sp.]
MKLKEGFITHGIDDEMIMVSTANTKFNGLTRSNRTASFILNCLKKDTTETEIVAAMLEKYDTTEDIIAADVKKILNMLLKIGALDE